MESYRVIYNDLRGQEQVEGFFNSFEALQEFMFDLLGRTFTAKVERFEKVPNTNYSKKTGEMNVFANTMENCWEKIETAG